LETNGIAARVLILEAQAGIATSERRELRDMAAANRERLSVHERDMKEMATDIRDVVAEIKWIRRGMWAAAAFLMTTTLMGVAILVNAL
jgi:hypothetical protein